MRELEDGVIEKHDLILEFLECMTLADCYLMLSMQCDMALEDSSLPNAANDKDAMQETTKRLNKACKPKEIS
jgi:hypothetical protein